MDKMRIHVLGSSIKQGRKGLQDFDYIVPLEWHRVPKGMEIGAVFAVMHLQSPKSSVAVVEMPREAIKKLADKSDRLPGKVAVHPSVLGSDPFSLKFAELFSLPEQEASYLRASQMSGFWIDAFKHQPRTPSVGNFYVGFATMGKVLGLSIQQICKQSLAISSLPSSAQKQTATSHQ